MMEVTILQYLLRYFSLDQSGGPTGTAIPKMGFNTVKILGWIITLKV